MLRGLTTTRYSVRDLDAAADWYTQLLETEPYYRRPGYVEFRIGDYGHELGLIDKDALSLLATDEPAPHELDDEPGGPLIYWEVDDVDQALARLLELGATPHEAPREFGDGFVAAAVVDPFGNALGIMRNPHYLEVLEQHSNGAAAVVDR